MPYYLSARSVMAGALVKDQVDLFLPDGFSRPLGIGPAGVALSLYVNNTLVPWPVISGSGVTDPLVSAGSVYWQELDPGFYGVRFFPNLPGAWRLIWTYATSGQTTILAYDVVAQGASGGASALGLKASFTPLAVDIGAMSCSCSCSNPYPGGHPPVYSPGVFVCCHTFSRGDLPIYFKDGQGNPTSPFKVTYTLYQNTASGCGPTMVGCPGRVPVNAAPGEYYATGSACQGGCPGDWFVEWSYQETADSPPSKVIFPFKTFNAAAYCPACCGSPCGCPKGW